jgi:hypothetical protein
VEYLKQCHQRLGIRLCFAQSVSVAEDDHGLIVTFRQQVREVPVGRPSFVVDRYRQVGERGWGRRDTCGLTVRLHDDPRARPGGHVSVQIAQDQGPQRVPPDHQDLLWSIHGSAALGRGDRRRHFPWFHGHDPVVVLRDRDHLVAGRVHRFHRWIDLDLAVGVAYPDGARRLEARQRFPITDPLERRLEVEVDLVAVEVE